MREKQRWCWLLVRTSADVHQGDIRTRRGLVKFIEKVSKSTTRVGILLIFELVLPSPLCSRRASSSQDQRGPTEPLLRSIPFHPLNPRYRACSGLRLFLPLPRSPSLFSLSLSLSLSLALSLFYFALIVSHVDRWLDDAVTEIRTLMNCTRRKCKVLLAIGKVFSRAVSSGEKRFAFAIRVPSRLI